MAVSFNSYYLYKKYEKRGNQPWIPVYPETLSIDGNGSMPKVLKTSGDPVCYVEPQERWVDTDGYTCLEVQSRTVTGTPYCNGTDLYADVSTQVSNNSGITWDTIETVPTIIESDSEYCGYNEYYSEYLTFVAEENNVSITWSGESNNNLSYSIDSGSTWSTPSSNFTSTRISSGGTIMVKGSCRSVGTYGIGRFLIKSKFSVYGNIFSLVYGDNFIGRKNFPSDASRDCCFFNALFFTSSGLTSAENLVLPATTLTKSCYRMMFVGCSNLETPPSRLPAPTLAEGCYDGMFYYCGKLTSLPTLPATTLTNSCYHEMFYWCSGLTSIPSNYLPATTLAEGCYTRMFQGCISLTSLDNLILSADTIQSASYGQMFFECSGLTAPPHILATTVGNSGCTLMFQNCTSLLTAPDLPATTVGEYGYSRMYAGCPSLTGSSGFSAETLGKSACLRMFEDCTSLTEAPDLPATTLGNYCYDSMFKGCRNLTRIPSILPATTLAEGCYANMFSGCTNIQVAPKLPAPTLAKKCYQSIFQDCRSLNNVICLATNASATDSTRLWLYNVSQNGTFYRDSNMNWPRGSGSYNVPSGWTMVDYVS